MIIQEIILCIKNSVSFAGMATTKWRHPKVLGINVGFAGMAKLVDALDLGSSGETHKSSSLFTRTKKIPR